MRCRCSGKDQLILLHTCSAYPSQYGELNLRVMPKIRERFGVPTGYSGHETGLPSSVAAVALGACMIERHITLDRTMYGSDQAASLGPSGVQRLVRDVRVVEESMGSSEKKLGEREIAVMKKLRRVGGRRMGQVKAIALDVDGVLTDDGFWWGPGGEEWKRFSFADVMGISIAIRKGIRFALISGENSPLVDRYAAKMSITDVYKGCKDKAAALRQFADKHDLLLAEICFMGNDVNDLRAIEIAGVSAAPADARPEVLAKAKLISTNRSGHGAVRDVIDMLLAEPSS